MIPTRVAVIFGGPSPEHDVSVLTGLQALHALSANAAVRLATGIYWSRTGAFFEVAASLEAAAFTGAFPDDATPIDLVAGADGGFYRRRRLARRAERIDVDAAVICCHGGPGEDGSLQGALDLAGIAYSGPSALGAALGMDKLASYALVHAAGLPALPRARFDGDAPDPGFSGPYIVKPRAGGSSIGVEVVADADTARARANANVHLRAGCVIEPYRADLFDLEIAVRTWPELELSEIARPLRKNDSSEILGFADKYVGAEGMTNAARELPANLPDALRSELRELAHAASEVLNARGVARIDFLSDGAELYVNEINTIPGSLSRYLFVSPPVDFSELLGELLEEAVARPAALHSAAGADGLVLRDAGSIASKLG